MQIIVDIFLCFNYFLYFFYVFIILFHPKNSNIRYCDIDLSQLLNIVKFYFLQCLMTYSEVVIRGQMISSEYFRSHYLTPDNKFGKLPKPLSDLR